LTYGTLFADNPAERSLFFRTLAWAVCFMAFISPSRTSIAPVLLARRSARFDPRGGIRARAAVGCVALQLAWVGAACSASGSHQPAPSGWGFDSGPPLTGIDAGANGGTSLDGGSTAVGSDGDSSLGAGGSIDAGSLDAAAPPDVDGGAGDAGVAKGDWSAGDYPPDLHAQTYLPLSGVSGQGDNVRGYKVHVPPSYDPKVPTPVLFALHGLSQNAVMFAVDGANWPAKSDAEGFILIMPTGNVQNSDGSWGLAGSWNAGECCGGAATAGLDDVALMRAIFADADEHLNLDHTRVYATGLSNGAFLSYRLACEASDLFVAVAPGSGAIGTPDIGPEGAGNADFKVCDPTHAVSVLAMHGTSDPLVPFGYFKPSLDHMAQANGCGSSTTPATVPSSGGDTTCVTYQGCPSGVEVTGCSVDGGGHCWFGSDNCGTGDDTGIGNAVVGANSDYLNDTDAAWAFLSRFSRR
jgi:polyhydroxybutyrate depolymerase